MKRLGGKRGEGQNETFGVFSNLEENTPRHRENVSSNFKMYTF